MTAKKDAAESFVDLDDIDPNAAAEVGATLQLTHPETGEPLGASLELYGLDARSYRVALRRLRDLAAANLEREPTDEDDALILSRARRAAAAVKGGASLRLKGEPAEYTPTGMVPVLVERPWIADQALEFISRRLNFKKA